ncbi:uncharacterized protein LOC122257125 [Penaeus japonicus]|uniref:uncharacterized protein LOC122257125 n=1 Tax=Penaeus japonicus TaxID=27405 RepID=UPI001C7137AB|nr:uncharacterized protein LOC122257125 [Penaeus japonicus]
MWAGFLPFLMGLGALRGVAAETAATYRGLLPTLTYVEITPASFTSVPDVVWARCMQHCKRSPACIMVAWQTSPSDCLMYDSLASGLPPLLSAYEVYVAVRDDRLFVVPNSVLWDDAKRICSEHRGRLFPLADDVTASEILTGTSLTILHIGLRRNIDGTWRNAQGTNATSVPALTDSTYDCVFFDVTDSFTTFDCTLTYAFPLCHLYEE